MTVPNSINSPHKQVECSNFLHLPDRKPDAGKAGTGPSKKTILHLEDVSGRVLDQDPTTVIKQRLDFLLIMVALDYGCEVLVKHPSMNIFKMQNGPLDQGWL